MSQQRRMRREDWFEWLLMLRTSFLSHLRKAVCETGTLHYPAWLTYWEAKKVLSVPAMNLHSQHTPACTSPQKREA